MAIVVVVWLVLVYLLTTVCLYLRVVTCALSSYFIYQPLIGTDSGWWTNVVMSMLNNLLGCSVYENDSQHRCNSPRICSSISHPKRTYRTLILIDCKMRRVRKVWFAMISETCVAFVISAVMIIVEAF